MKPRGIKDKILALHAEGRDYGQIQRELKCSKGTIAYHIGEGQKEKVLSRTRRNRAKRKLALSKHK